MRKIMLCVFLAFLAAGCNKDIGRTVNQEEQPELTVVVNSDSAYQNNDTAEGNVDISSAEVNEHEVYSFMGISGVYFGCSSTFKTDSESLQFIFGTNLTTNLAFSQEEFEQLIHPGERQFGSLGAFTSFPERYSDRVEIAYTDKKGRRWCSTRITEKNNGGNVETTVKIEQQQSEFFIEDAHKFEIAAEAEGYRLKGRFACMLYEVNGNAKRKIKGDFTAVVAPK